jgi:hypothetical protein
MPNRNEKFHRKQVVSPSNAEHNILCLNNFYRIRDSLSRAIRQRKSPSEIIRRAVTNHEFLRMVAGLRFEPSEEPLALQGDYEAQGNFFTETGH